MLGLGVCMLGVPEHCTLRVSPTCFVQLLFAVRQLHMADYARTRVGLVLLKAV